MVIQTSARHVAHDDVRLLSVPAKVVDRYDAGMLQGGDQLGFLLKEFLIHIVQGAAVHQYLHNNLTLNIWIASQKNQPHAPLCQFLLYIITTNFGYSHPTSTIPLRWALV